MYDHTRALHLKFVPGVLRHLEASICALHRIQLLYMWVIGLVVLAALVFMHPRRFPPSPS